MDQQPEHAASAQNPSSDAISRTRQIIDRFVMFPGPPRQSAQSARDELSLEPPVVAPASARVRADREYTRTSPQGRDQLNALDLLLGDSPVASSSRNRVLPTSVALMMARGTHKRSPSILERYAQTVPMSASCQSVQKRCLFPDCTKMSVSKGLCRGHGGGRRCHFAGGCTKSAQSRSMLCWAHGGGQRCDVETCMRSRKTKHYCVAHMHLETEASRNSTQSGKSSRMPRTRRSRYVPVPTRAQRPSSQRMLPSLGQALSAASHSLPSFPMLPQVRAWSLDERV
jgi:hypothetical protein